MKTYRGFSLIEVLLSLLLISSLAIAALRQQWQMNQLLNQALIRSTTSTQLENNAERLLAGQLLARFEEGMQSRKINEN